MYLSESKLIFLPCNCHCSYCVAILLGCNRARHYLLLLQYSMRFFSSTELFKNWISSPQIIWLSKKPIVLSCWISMQYIGWKVERSQFRCSVLENSLKKLFQYETQAKKVFYFFAALVALCVHTVVKLTVNCEGQLS